MNFEYFISQKDDLVVISLRGSFDGDHFSVAQKCLKEALSRKPVGAILALAAINDFPADGFRSFSLLMRGLKVNCKVVRVAGLRDQVKKALIEQGLLSGSDVRETLADAVKDVVQQMMSFSR